MQLTNNFTLSELTHSNTARALGIDNTLPPYSWPFYTALDRVNYVFLSGGNEPFLDGRLPYQLA